MVKKSIFLSLLFSLTILGAGLLLSSCEEIESGYGTLKVTNNSTIRIIYVSLEKGSSIVSETSASISPGSSRSFTDISTGFYTVYVEDSDGDGWATKSSVTVRKDDTAEVKFPGDFKVSN
jgi:hypothetical protein